MDRVSSTVSDVNFFYLRLTSLALHFHLHSRLPSLAKRITFFQLNYIYVPPLFWDIKNFVIRCQNLNSTSTTSPFLNFSPAFVAFFSPISTNLVSFKYTFVHDPYDILFARITTLIFQHWSGKNFDRTGRRERRGNNVDRQTRTRAQRSSSVRISVRVLPLVVYYRQRNRKHRLSRKPFSSLSVHGLPAAIHVN